MSEEMLKQILNNTETLNQEVQEISTNISNISRAQENLAEQVSEMTEMTNRNFENIHNDISGLNENQMKTNDKLDVLEQRVENIENSMGIAPENIEPNSDLKIK